MPTLKAVPQVLPDGRLSVCAWCYPGESVFEQYPWLKMMPVNAPTHYSGASDNLIARPITHGVCQEHQTALMAEVSALNFTAVAKI